jgi:hypothetical protein
MAKIIFKQGEELIKDVNLDDLKSSDFDYLKKEFDSKPILKYELTFGEGILLGDCHNIDSIDLSKIEKLTVTLR